MKKPKQGKKKPLNKLPRRDPPSQAPTIIFIESITINNSPPPPRMSEKFIEKIVSVVCGVVFVAVILALSVVIPNPTRSQAETFRIVLSLAAAGFVSMAPGFLEVSVSKWVRGGGALAAFLVVYFFSPAVLPT